MLCCSGPGSTGGIQLHDFTATSRQGTGCQYQNRGNLLDSWCVSARCLREAIWHFGGAVSIMFPISEQGRPRVAGSNSSEVTLSQWFSTGDNFPSSPGDICQCLVGRCFWLSHLPGRGGSCLIVGGGQGCCSISCKHSAAPHGRVVQAYMSAVPGLRCSPIRL